ncbi:MAG: penicillin-binding transpeptidase domain-containing protein [Ignavibacteriales bacterium]|nr:penicillin-binding transpeptidase domain-containing protein [Ignavibacteriales bacterium]
MILMSEEKHKHSVLKYKTGTGTKEDGTFIGWLVGYVEKEKNVYLFAFNIEAKTFDEVRKLRDESSRAIFRKLKVLE